METQSTIESYENYCRPALVRILKSVGLDVAYYRAKGNYLWWQSASGPVKVLDLIGGYGSTLHGHNHPALVKYFQTLLKQQTPVLTQASIRSGAGELAKKLNELLGDYKVIFTNSGTETLEAAIKHVLLERSQPVFWCLQKSFHGKTLGAIQLTEGYRKPFKNPFFNVQFINPNDIESLKALESSAPDVAAIFIEPLQGEGGIHPIPPAFVSWVNKISTQYDIPVIVDEIQSGTGRTGSFLYSDQIGLRHDYICLSKSLGGGMVKIGALLISSQRFVEEFSIIHTSTFAEDDLSSKMALRALQLSEEEQLTERCKKQGLIFLEKLGKVSSKYPDVIESVRGIGLMIGVELKKQDLNPSKIIQMLSINESIAAMAAGYFLNIHKIRIAPTLSNMFTLRLQPSAYINEKEMDRFCIALTKFCQAIRSADGGHLINFLAQRKNTPVKNYKNQLQILNQPPASSIKVAFIGHLIDAHDLKLWDSSLKDWEEDELESLIEKFSKMAKPHVYEKVNITSATGETVHLNFIGLFLYSKQIEKAYRERNYDWILDLINESVKVANQEKCQVLGFGGYTSILTANCKRIKDPGLSLTSGNSLTAGFGVLALCKIAERKNIPLETSTLGIIGAKGNIASIYAKLMAPKVGKLILFVRKKDDAEIIRLENLLKSINKEISISIEDDFEQLNRCNLIISSSNSAKPIIFPPHIKKEGTVLICDISVPSNVDASVYSDCDNVIVIPGGIVKLPIDDRFVIRGIPLKKGHIFACLGETLLMGLQNGDKKFKGSVGAISESNINDILELAEKHGFEVECETVSRKN